MRIATFNINGVNQRLANLLDWLVVTEPDVVCLQETKCSDRDFPFAVLERAGYGAIARGAGGLHGIAMLARGAPPVETRRELPGDPLDRQPRYLEAAVEGVLVASMYFPNGNPQPGPKFDYKLAWMERLNAHAANLLATGFPVVLAGDYNVVPTDFDIYGVRSYKDNALLQPAPRAAYARLLAQGWTDAVRHAHPDERVYTFWAYLRNAWPRDAGLRIDHLLLSPDLMPRLREVGVDRSMRGEPGASDHVPAWVEIE